MDSIEVRRIHATVGRLIKYASIVVSAIRKENVGKENGNDKNSDFPFLYFPFVSDMWQTQSLNHHRFPGLFVNIDDQPIELDVALAGLELG
jgi:hypothetical protein